jgi:predicted restriction endonuclease
MEKLNKYQKGAQTTKKILQERSLKNYYNNPKICKNCGKIIEVKENEKPRHVRKKTFCDSSCSATYNNKVRELKREKKVVEVIKREKKEKFEFLLDMTKKELYEKHGVYYKFRAVVRKHAHYVFNKHTIKKECLVCGYSDHVEVCHIKSVSSFGDDELMRNINSIDNLIGLCPNHHWEFDNGKIDISREGVIGCMGRS